MAKHVLGTNALAYFFLEINEEETRFYNIDTWTPLNSTMMGANELLRPSVASTRSSTHDEQGKQP
jgi:hypothetical protein